MKPIGCLRCYYRNDAEHEYKTVIRISLGSDLRIHFSVGKPGLMKPASLEPSSCT